MAEATLKPRFLIVVG